MRRPLTFAVILVALYVAQTAPVRADNCVADPVGGLACGEGKGALRVFADSTLPSKGYAFVWRSPEGLSSGNDFPLGEVLIRLADGAVLAKLGGTYWDTGQMHANRHDLMAA